MAATAIPAALPTAEEYHAVEELLGQAAAALEELVLRVERADAVPTLADIGAAWTATEHARLDVATMSDTVERLRAALGELDRRRLDQRA
jgi:hypothetical protein